ncbi:Protein CBR-EAF-1 [Caenorhabditis briggsae]|uniref:Ell-associated factor Eaf n=2 Tax=Caenorhabditis briggsae TaxID=6238 RepID=A8Y1Y0_CAEBR|nr:Protein CBR-EAF-1 [Caenorhabditis briggsae]ULU09857.1 hypothetical protein L3Y34_014316 [Caenorhabditis briggsae]CAP38900.1 Protein CBR-EAF-1 [Caenorhabditis briggsae]
MSESSDIPTGTYSLSLGRSFDTKGRKNDPKAAQFHTLRYDFKPSSVSNNVDNTFIAFGSNSQDVHVSVPSEGGDNMTVYKGSKKDAKPKECLLFFDKKTGMVRLEKITSNINVKKTRDLDPATEQALKRGIERLRTTASSNPQHLSSSSSPEEKQRPPPPVQDTSDSESDSDSDSDDKSNVDSSDDDERALMEQMKQQQPAEQPTNSYHQESHVAPPPPSYNTSYGSSSSNRNTRINKDSEKYGLALSESSDEDD